MSRGWQRAAALLLFVMLLPAAPAAGEMMVAVNQVEISLEMRNVEMSSGTQIVIRADLTEPQKAGGDGDADIDVALVVVLGTFLDDPSRQNLSGMQNNPDPIDDNEYPPKDEQGNEYDRYTLRFPAGPGGYDAEGAYTGQIEFTLTALNQSGERESRGASSKHVLVQIV